MKIKISQRTNSYAIYVERDDEEELAEWAVHMVTQGRAVWLQEIHDSRFKKIIVLRHVAPPRRL
jgi:hypothetical protein